MRADAALRRKIKQSCRESGLSVYRIAYLAGMPPSTIKNIVYGKSRNPGFDTICKICLGLGMTLGEFFSDALFDEIEPD